MQRRTFMKTTGALGVSAMLARPGSAVALIPAESSAPDTWMQDVVEEARRLGAAQADALSLSHRHQSIQVRKDVVHGISDTEEDGITLRVRVGMALGSASVPASRRGSPKDLARRAVEMARATPPSIREGSIALDGELHPDVHVMNTDANGVDTRRWSTAGVTDPFLVPLDERIAFLRDLNATALRIPQIPYAVSNQFLQMRTTTHVDSRGGRFTQQQYASYVNFAVTAYSAQRKLMDTRTSEREAQSTDWTGATASMRSELETAMQEVLQLQRADPVTPDHYDIVVHPTLLWNILFETLLPHFDPRQLTGLDGRLPGDRWITLAQRGRLPLSSPALRLRWDNTLRGGLASSGWDDTGVAAAVHPLLDGSGAIGRIPRSLDLLLSDPVYGLGFPGMTFSRAPAWNLPPTVAMPNVVLEGGPGKNLDALIAGVDDGLFVKGRGTVVTNPGKTLFRVRPQVAWKIRGGKIVEMVREVEIETSTEQFWNALVEVGRGEDTFLGGDLFPRRAFPLWETPFSVATPPALFRSIPTYRAEARA